MASDFSSKFRSTMNGYLLLDIFYENRREDKTGCIYTTKDKDYLGYPSLYRLYMEMEDLTEYEFANTYLDGWEHWQKLCQCNWFEPLVTRWREELSLKFKARALKELRVMAGTENRNKFMANKYFLEWNKKVDDVGRPSKLKIKEEAEKMFKQEQFLPNEQEILKQFARVN